MLYIDYRFCDICFEFTNPFLRLVTSVVVDFTVCKYLDWTIRITRFNVQLNIRWSNLIVFRSWNGKTVFDKIVKYKNTFSKRMNLSPRGESLNIQNRSDGRVHCERLSCATIFDKWHNRVLCTKLLINRAVYPADFTFRTRAKFPSQNIVSAFRNVTHDTCSRVPKTSNESQRRRNSWKYNYHRRNTSRAFLRFFLDEVCARTRIRFSCFRVSSRASWKRNRLLRRAKIVNKI